MIRTEIDIQQEIKNALVWEPLLFESDITVLIEDGMVTLDGAVDTEEKKQKAEEVAKRVARLQAINNDIEVVSEEEERMRRLEKKRSDKKKMKKKSAKKAMEREDNELQETLVDDRELEHEVKEAFRWNAEIKPKHIKVVAKDGWITLEGTVQHTDQMDQLRQLASEVEGVKGVANLLKVVPPHDEEREETEEFPELRNKSENRREPGAEKNLYSGEVDDYLVYDEAENEGSVEERAYEEMTEAMKTGNAESRRGERRKFGRKEMRKNPLEEKMRRRAERRREQRKLERKDKARAEERLQKPGKLRRIIRIASLVGTLALSVGSLALTARKFYKRMKFL